MVIAQFELVILCVFQITGQLRVTQYLFTNP